jgi:hypothetical protein
VFKKDWIMNFESKKIELFRLLGTENVLPNIKKQIEKAGLTYPLND